MSTAQAAVLDRDINIGAQIAGAAAERSKPDIGAIIDECIARADGEIDEAAAMLRKALRAKFPAYMAEIEAEAVKFRLSEMLRKRLTDVRRSIASEHVAPQRGLTASTMQAFARGWMDWSMRDGTPLRDATRPKVMESANYYIASGATMTRRGQWLQAIAEKLRDDKTKVRDVLDEKTVEKLARENGVVKE